MPNNTARTKNNNDDDETTVCAICLDEYSNPKCTVSANEKFSSAVCQHSLCLKCVVQHVIAYRRDFCPLCRRTDAFQDEALQAHISKDGKHIPSSIEPMIAAAVDTRVKESLVYPCIEQMTEMLAEDTSVTQHFDRPLPTMRLSPRHLLSTCSILRREDSFLATFALTAQDSGETVYYRAEHSPILPRNEENTMTTT